MSEFFRDYKDCSGGVTRSRPCVDGLKIGASGEVILALLSEFVAGRDARNPDDRRGEADDHEHESKQITAVSANPHKRETHYRWHNATQQRSCPSREVHGTYSEVTRVQPRSQLARTRPSVVLT